MALDYPIPRANSGVVDSRSAATPEWYDFFRTLASTASAEGLREALEALQAEVAALAADDKSPTITGLNSVAVFGSLSDGTVQIQLNGDQDAPGPTYYYGTGPDGTKGWYTIGSALYTTTLAKSVDPTTGVVVFDLALFADSGVGAALVKTTRDVYGRVSGTQAAKLGDLSDINLTGIANGYTLVYDLATTTWKSAAGGGGGGGVTLAQLSTVALLNTPFL